MSGTIGVLYVRHARSESNCPDNSGVHILDSPLTTEQVEENWRAKGISGAAGAEGAQGREWASKDLRGAFKKRFDNWRDGGEQNQDNRVLFMVSPLRRAIQTFLLVVQSYMLVNAKIIFEPLLIEQTHWASDRVRKKSDIENTIENELDRKSIADRSLLGPDDLKSLKARNAIVWNVSELGDFAKGMDWVEKIKRPTGTGDEAESLPWHLKDGGWDPKHVMERGQAAVQGLVQNASEFGGCRHVCVFGHGGFANFMTEEVGEVNLDITRPKLTNWQVGEMREYQVPGGHKNQLMRETGTDRNERLSKLGVPLEQYDLGKENERRKKMKDHLIKMKNDEEDPGYNMAKESWKNSSSFKDSKVW